MQKMIGDIAELVLAADLETATALFEGEKFDLVLCDFMFPNGDAMPLLFRIRQKFSPKQLPIVMLTSAADRVTTSKFYQIGVNATVRKPPDPDRFRDLLLQMLHEPWVEKPDYVAADFQLVHWSGADRAYVFCTNLALQTDGPTPEAALQAMREKIDAVLAAELPVPAITTPKISTYNPASRLQRGVPARVNGEAGGPVV